MSAPRPILIHGAVGGPACWAGQDGHFPGAAAVALPGHPGGGALDDLDRAADWVARIIRAVPGPRALVGHGLGAAIALEVVLRDPAPVAGVVAVACGPTLPYDGISFGGLAEDTGAEVDRLLASCLSEPGGAAGATMAAAMRAAGPATLTADLAMAREVDLRGRLSTLPVPVMVVAGGADTVVPPDRVAALADEIPVCERVIVPGARHLVMADDARAFNLVLAAYLARLELTEAA